METITQLWPILSGVVVVPIVGWIKTVVAPQWAPLLSLIVSVALVAILWRVFGEVWDWEQILLFAFGTQVVGQLTKGGYKIVKNGG